MKTNADTATEMGPEASLEQLEALTAKLESMSDEELVEKARAAGIDGAENMTCEQLLARMKSEPGETEH